MNNDIFIGLIAGHGGKDPGCTFYNSIKEKNYVLDIVEEMREIIKKYIKNIYCVRTDDETISRKERANYYNYIQQKYNTDIDIYSIHVNAFNKNARGAEIFKSIHNNTDTNFLNYMLKEYCKKFGFDNRGVKTRESIKHPGQDYYDIINFTNSRCRTKIIELGFGDNKADCNLLMEHKHKIAEFLATKILSKYDIIIDNKESKVKYVVQTGAFTSRLNAQKQVEKLKESGFDPIIKQL